MERRSQGVTAEEQEVTEDQEAEEDRTYPGAEVFHQKEAGMMMDTDSMLQVGLIDDI